MLEIQIMALVPALLYSLNDFVFVNMLISRLRYSYDAIMLSLFPENANLNRYLIFIDNVGTQTGLVGFYQKVWNVGRIIMNLFGFQYSTNV
jgi:hypothetical protein